MQIDTYKASSVATANIIDILIDTLITRAATAYVTDLINIVSVGTLTSLYYGIKESNC